MTITPICISSGENSSGDFKSEAKLAVAYENESKNSKIFSQDRYGSSESHLLGKSPFTTEDDQSLSILEEYACPVGFEWDGSWELDQSFIGSYEDGWVYAEKWSGPWSKSSSLRSKVRRRRWVRKYRPKIDTGKDELDGHNNAVNHAASIKFKPDSDLIAEVEKGLVSDPHVKLNFFYEKIRLLPHLTGESRVKFEVPSFPSCRRKFKTNPLFCISNKVL